MVSNGISIKLAISIWWSYFWRATVGAMLFSFVLGFGVSRLAPTWALRLPVVTVLLWAVYVAFSIWALKRALEQRHAGSVITVSQQPVEYQQP